MPRIDAPARVHSIDALRGVVMLSMVFVNDLAGVGGLPWWAYHYARSVPGGGVNFSGMTPVDWVFPAFLFVLGMSVPIALASRAARGEPAWRTVLHVLSRGGALILLGFFKVNQAGPIAAIGWPAHLWNVLMFACAIAAFLTVPGKNARPTIATRAVGFVGLALLAVIHFRYVGPMTPKWWEILGLLGWAYLAACFACAACGGSRAGLTAGIGLLIGLYVLEAAGEATGPAILGVRLGEHFAWGTTLGTHAAVAVCGVLFATAFLPGSPESALRERLRFAVRFVALVLLAVAVTLPLYGVNKETATPAWGLLSTAATAVLFVPLWWWVDERGGVRSSWLLRTAGQHALLIYLLQSMLYPLFALTGFAWHGRLGQMGTEWAICRGVGMAVGLTLLAWGLSRLGLRLRL